MKTMNRILINTYLGIDVYFDNDMEKFTFKFQDEEHVTYSYHVVKKDIEHLIRNKEFKSFYVEHIHSCFDEYGEKLEVVGMTFDGDFIINKMDGERNMICREDLQDYMLFKDENIHPIQKLKEIDLKEEQQKRENDNERQLIISTLSITSLETIHKNLLNSTL